MLPVSQARLSAFRLMDPSLDSLAYNSSFIGKAEDAPEPFEGIAERYYLLVKEAEDPLADYVEIVAYSKSPLMLGGRVKISCLNLGCSITWSGNDKDQFLSGRLNSVFAQTACGGMENCITREAIDAHFEKLERLIADFETVLNRLKIRPMQEQEK